MKLKEIMSRECPTIYAGQSVEEAIACMAKEGRGLLVVLEGPTSKKVVGVLSNKDIINNVLALRKNPASIQVRKVMSANVISLEPNATSAQAMLLMEQEGIKRIVILKGGMLQGIVSTHDLIRGMLRHKKDLLDMAIDF